MQSWAEYKAHLKNKRFLISVFVGILLLILSIVMNFYAGLYAVERASNSVTDLILSNTQTMDVDGIFIYGSFIFWIFVTILCLLKPNRIPFILKSIALFVFIRSIFISVTHIKMERIKTKSAMLLRIKGMRFGFNKHRMVTKIQNIKEP